jgi:hypothetical protein
MNIERVEDEHRTSNIERSTSNETPVNQIRALLWPFKQWRSDCWMLPWNGKMVGFIFSLCFFGTPVK